MVLGLILMSGLTEAVVRQSSLVRQSGHSGQIRHSGQYLQCSRGDCLMLGDSEVDLMFDQPKYLLIYRLRL